METKLISELILELEELKVKHGDIPVIVTDYGHGCLTESMPECEFQEYENYRDVNPVIVIE